MSAAVLSVAAAVRPVLSVFAAVAVFLMSASAVSAQTRLPSIIGSGMVLQQSSDVPVWGWDIPGQAVRISVSWSSDIYEAVAGSDGRWETEVSTPSAGGPFTVTVEGSQKLTLKDVLAGEVWICSGQSNMAMPVRGYTSQPVEDSYSTVLEAPQYSGRIHIFNVTKDSSSVAKADCEGRWRDATCKNVASISAVAWGFAVRLAEALDVPVGIVVSAYGGTRIEPWVPADALADALEGVIPAKSIDRKLSERNVPGKKPSAAGTIYNAMIAPLAPYKAKGFLWYQGCSSRNDYSHYASMQTALVSEWRNAWRDEDASMPFIFATIAPYSYGDADDDVRAYFVENQLSSLSMIPGSHAVVTEGFGEKDCIHPSRKGPVADQMAWTALATEYGMDGIPVGYPAYERHEINGDTVTIYFSNARYGLCPSYGEPVRGFRVAGKDRVFHEAEAVIKGNPLRVEVRSGEVKAPVAVRYSFLNWCESNLTSLYGVPVPPFRTDSWPREN